MKYLVSDCHNLKKEAGFTLLEVLIAMAILVVSLASILAVEGGSIEATIKAKRMNVVAMLAKNQMVESEFKIQGKKFDEVRKEETGTFEPPYQDYSWKMTVKELKFPQISDLMKNEDANNSNQEQGANPQTELIGRVVTNYLSKAIREVTVTIIWKQSGKEQDFALATYWVDLNHEFSITE